MCIARDGLRLKPGQEVYVRPEAVCTRLHLLPSAVGTVRTCFARNIYVEVDFPGQRVIVARTQLVHRAIPGENLTTHNDDTTDTQNRVCEYITNHWAEHAKAPTLRAIQEALDFRNINSVCCVLKSLRSKGKVHWIHRGKGTLRTCP
jgi:hypothetical protein